jgi:cation diffusion facilitator family transporter
LLVVGVGMLWSALHKLATPGAIASVHVVALWTALAALAAKELLFRYMLAVAERVRSSMLVANAWHARSDAASSLVVALGIAGNLLGYPLLDPVAALIVGLMVLKMGGEFAWDALHDLMDRAADEVVSEKIRNTLIQTPGVLGIHDLRTRKMGDLIVVDVHLEIRSDMTVREGHDIAVAARQRVMASLPVLNVMTHVDPVAPPPVVR